MKHAFWLLLALSLLNPGAAVRADAPPQIAPARLRTPRPAMRGLDVARALRGLELGTRVDVLEDERGELSVEQLASPALAARFQRSRAEMPSFGYTQSAYWLRFTVENSGPLERSWLLEVGYPLLDYVTLYLPRSGGDYERRETGDMRPFARRDLAYRNFVFLLEEPPRSARTYYLRVATSGSMTLPVRAWTMQEFIEHQHLDWAGLCVFYGVILVMAAYNASLYLFTRQREYLHYTLFVLSVGLVQLTLVGHVSEFILPNETELVQLLLPLSVGLALYFAFGLARFHLPEDELPQWYKRLHFYTRAYSLCVAGLSLVTPYHFSSRLAVASCMLLCTVGFGATLVMMRSVQRATGALLGWMGLIAGVAVTVLRTAGVVPTNQLTLWSVQLGASVTFVLLSAGLAGKLNAMRAAVDLLNCELAGKVHSLEEAVSRARAATERAERATRVKDEFVATMSHELRTPLNAIINLPQGLLEDFPECRYAVCAHCATTFELDPGEKLTSDTSCPECLTTGSLALRELVRYAGRPERTMRYLEKIERSGTHLLQVMNGILLADRAPEGGLALSFSPEDVLSLVREVVEEMSDLAERAGVRLNLVSMTPQEPLLVDRLRLRQVLINLIGNAIKFSNGRGSVQVSVETAPDHCLFSVRDQGIGIAPENFETIFASFEQVHELNARRYGGTGLGLFISRSLVRLHGGDLWVESKLGQGATFRFRIPRAARREHEQGRALAG